MTQPCDPAAPIAPANLTLTPGDQRDGPLMDGEPRRLRSRGLRDLLRRLDRQLQRNRRRAGASPIIVTPDAVTHGDLCTLSLTGLDACVTLYIAVSAVDRCSPPNEGLKVPRADAMTTCTACGMSAGCASWITTTTARRTKTCISRSTRAAARDEILAKLVPTYTGTAKVLAGAVWASARC